MTCTRTRLGVIAEVLAAASVIASLAMVAAELSENAKATRAAAASEVLISLSEWYTDVSVQGRGGSLFAEGMRDPGALGRHEQVDFVFMLHGGMLLYQNAFVLGQEGALDNTLRAVTTETLSAIVHEAGFQFYWGQRRMVFVPGFRDYVDGLMTSEKSAISDLYEDPR